MNNDSNTREPNNLEPGQEGAGNQVGEMIRSARQRAGIDLNKMASDLRISHQRLEFLEKGEYGHLSGDPYIRAFLGSISRYLNLDAQEVLAAYNRGIGSPSIEQVITITPEKTPTKKSPPKQLIFIVVLALLATLFFLIGRLNRSDLDADVITPEATPQALGDSPGIPGDTATLESKALAPDSADSAAFIRDSSALETSGQPAAPQLNSATFKPLVDSAWVKVQRSGKEDYNIFLRIGKQMQVSHTDTIFITIGRKGTVEVNIGDAKIVPIQRKFKIHDGKVM